MNTFGDKIKSFRIAHNLTQKALAEKLSITVSSLSHWECGYQEPSFDLLTKLADFFECSTDYLLNREDDFGNVVVNSETTPTLSDDEKELLKIFQSLDPIHQKQILGYAQGFYHHAHPNKNFNF